MNESYKVRILHPHKYLLHYLTSVRDWMDERDWMAFPVPKAAWSILQVCQDFCSNNNILLFSLTPAGLHCIQVNLTMSRLKHKF